MDESGRLKQDQAKTQWHRWFGDLFKIILTPFGIDVYTEYPVMKDPPEADIIIIRKNQPEWSIELLKYLPDGIRDCKAPHIIIEFKYTESVNETALCKTLGYRVFYKLHNELKDEDIQAVIVSSKTPSDATLKEFGYVSSNRSGIYRSAYPLVRLIPLISLNDLNDEPYNAFVKLFSGKRKARLSALNALGIEGLTSLPNRLKVYMGIFLKLMFGYEGDMNMEEMEYIKITPEEMARIIEIMKTVVPMEEILSGIKMEDIISIVKLERILSAMKPEDILSAMKPEDILSAMKPEDILSAMKPEDIKAYLNKLEQTQATQSS